MGAGADPNEGEWQGLFKSIFHKSPLRQAAGSNQAEIVELLLEAGARPTNGLTVGPLGVILRASPIADCADNDKVQVVRALLKGGVSPNAGWAVGYGLVSKGGLVQSASGGAEKVFEVLKEHGARLHQSFQIGPGGIFVTQSALHSAAEGGNPTSALGIVKTLLDFGATPASAGLQIGPFGCLGTSYPLSKAAEGGKAEVAELLLVAGAKPTRGWSLFCGLLASGSPLYRASMQGAYPYEHDEEKYESPEAATVPVLLSYKTPPCKGDGVGPFGILAHMTPLFAAAENGKVEACRKLVEGGATVKGGFSILSVPIRSPLEWATSKGHGAVKSFLEEQA